MLELILPKININLRSQSRSHQLLCDYEYVQRCRKFSTEVKFIVANKIQTKHINKVTAVVSGQDMTTNQELVSQKEINNLLGSFYTTEMRFRSIVTAKDVEVCHIVIY